MTLTRTAKRKAAATTSIVLVSTVCGFLYPFLFRTQHPPGTPQWHSHVNGILIGGLMGLAIAGGEIHLFQSRIRRLRFSFFIVIQTAYYFVTVNASIIGIMVFHFMMFHDASTEEAFRMIGTSDFIGGKEFLSINLYALVLIFSITFVRRVNRMLGHNALWNFITGKYHQPVEESRVFMFLDLKTSTSIAEHLGHMRYHQFLNDFFYDITPAIVESKGEIYQYVGDEVVVTWTQERGLRDANCINCYFRIAAAIAKVSDKYDRKYGFTPTFKAGFHYGTVIAGLIGDIKRDIVFHGDTVNTASRIRSECTVANRDLLLSHHLLERLSISTYLTPQSIGKIRLRGKEEEIELFGIKEAA
jgi:adenylate cyclase